jgi:hypothetical protein
MTTEARSETELAVDMGKQGKLWQPPQSGIHVVHVPTAAQTYATLPGPSAVLAVVVTVNSSHGTAFSALADRFVSFAAGAGHFPAAPRMILRINQSKNKECQGAPAPASACHYSKPACSG